MIRVIFSLLVFLFPLLAQAKETVCLVMIVKDESRVIKRCLDSVKSIIDYWVIVDTGSTDGTQEIIKKHMQKIPGKLYQRPWRNFGENRTESIELAQGKGDYFLFMDADDILEFDKGFQLPPLTHDLYHMWRGVKGFTYLKPQLVRASLPWKWVGVTHEYLDCGQPYSSDILKNVKYMSCDGGARSYGTDKFWKNIALLLDGLKTEPDNARYAFYLAESYHDAGEKGKALEWYQKRIKMGGWNEEVFWAKLRSSHLLKDIGLPSDVVINSYIDTHNFRPHRMEPLYYLAEIYNQESNYAKAYACLKAKDAIVKPSEKDSLFNEDWIEEYGLLFQLSICSYYLGHYQESLDTCDKLLAMKDLPDSWRKLTEENRKFPLEKLNPKSTK